MFVQETLPRARPTLLFSELCHFPHTEVSYFHFLSKGDERVTPYEFYSRATTQENTQNTNPLHSPHPSPPPARLIAVSSAHNGRLFQTQSDDGNALVGAYAEKAKQGISDTSARGEGPPYKP